MIYSFKTLDDELWVINTSSLKWGRASSILSAPSVTAVENEITQYEFLEGGDLVPMGAGIYNFDGRTPETKGPGAGLSSVGIIAIPFEDTLVVYLRPNVPIKADSFKSNPIKIVKYEVLQDPQPPQIQAEEKPNEPAEGAVVKQS